MELNKLIKSKGVHTKSKRRGRGIGSGKGGHTTGFGMKGQKARSGNSIPFGFEGGQVPIFKKMPKIGGFKNPTRKDIKSIILNKLNVFEENAVVTAKEILSRGLIKKMPRHGIKIVSSGDIEKKLTIRGLFLSEGAKIKLEKAGCVIEN